jgi:hypothetical protein
MQNLRDLRVSEVKIFKRASHGAVRIAALMQGRVK